MAAILGALMFGAEWNDSPNNYGDDDTDDSLSDIHDDSYTYGGRLEPSTAVAAIALFLPREKTEKRADMYEGVFSSSANKYDSVARKEVNTSTRITNCRPCRHIEALVYPRLGPGNPCPTCYRLETNPPRVLPSQIKHTRAIKQTDLSKIKQENILNNSRKKQLRRCKKIKIGLGVVAVVLFPVTVLYLMVRTRDPYNTENNKGDLEAMANTTEKVLIKMRVLKKLRRHQ